MKPKRTLRYLLAYLINYLNGRLMRDLNHLSEYCFQRAMGLHGSGATWGYEEGYHRHLRNGTRAPLERRGLRRHIMRREQQTHGE